ALVVAGVDLGKEPVHPGGEATVTLYLEGRGRVPDGFRLFTHFVGANGRSINADHEPLEGSFPITRLGAGVWLRDRVKVALPADFPKGPLTVEVGLFKRGERAPAAGAHAHGGAVRVATLQVTPP